jgi:diguanylate cyclase (GGDEF)-like protein
LTIVKISRDKVGIWAAVYTLVGAVTCVLNLSTAKSHDVKQFLLYLVCANAAVLGLRLITGHSLLPAGFLVLLLGVEDLNLPELLFIAFTVTLLNELQRDRGRPPLVTVMFAVANITIGLASAQLVYRMTANWHASALFPLPIIASSFVLLFNYGLARTLLARGTAPLIGIYRSECRPVLPWFIAAAYLAYLVRCASVESGVHAALITLPILFVLDRGYRAWSEARENHAAELALLHQRTLETLSVVINARDYSANQHLHRVQVYSKAIGKELGLNASELDDLHVATLVYNIGQLGVPDHILLKPGTLTQDEWEKVKTHPVTGAEMLARMNFPVGVRAIVQTHHEKWDGSGYPANVKGEQIPIGARILAAVDSLDALASDRPFRRALPIRDAMEQIIQESGRSFDPRVVDILERRYMELESKAWVEARQNQTIAPSPSASRDLGKLAARLLVESDSSANSVVSPIVSARQETQLLQVLATDVAPALQFEEIAAAAEKCLGQIIHYDTLVLYVRRGEKVEPVCLRGRNAYRFLREPVPIAACLSGRALRDNVPVVNGNPSLECCYVQDAAMIHPLQSALVVPLEGREGAAGVLTLYHVSRDAFSRDHLRFVKAAGSHLGVALEGAQRYQDAENLAGTDHLTGVANNRSLALHLERELSRASRENASIGVLVCDLNGFKQVNDRFGHLRGNEVLQRAALGFKEICRSSDYLARLGGDEFVVVVPGLKEELGDSYASRLEAVAVEAGWSVCGEQCLSLSVGIAIYPADGADPESLLMEADRRMYQAKEQHKRGQRLLSEGAAT